MQGLATKDVCTQESSSGNQYGALCYDVGGCCPTATSDSKDQLKGDDAAKA